MATARKFDNNSHMWEGFNAVPAPSNRVCDMNINYKCNYLSI